MRALFCPLTVCIPIGEPGHCSVFSKEPPAYWGNSQALLAACIRATAKPCIKANTCQPPFPTSPSALDPSHIFVEPLQNQHLLQLLMALQGQVILETIRLWWGRGKKWCMFHALKCSVPALAHPASLTRHHSSLSGLWLPWQNCMPCLPEPGFLLPSWQGTGRCIGMLFDGE